MSYRLIPMVVCVLLPAAGCADRVAETEDKAVMVVQKFGGHVARDQNDPAKSVVLVDLSDTPVTDVALKELAVLKGLQRLDLSRTKVTDAGLKGLADMKGLQTLYLRGTKVTDAGLKDLAVQRYEVLPKGS